MCQLKFCFKLKMSVKNVQQLQEDGSIREYHDEQHIVANEYFYFERVMRSHCTKEECMR